MKIRDRVFGAPVEPDIIKIFNKLQQRKIAAEAGESVSDSVNDKFYLGDKTPFVRMWTAVNVIGIDEKKKEENPDSDDWKTFYESFYYVVNDNAQNSYEPNQHLTGKHEHPHGKRVGQLGPNENSNPYMKPAAGITGVSSKTEGALGAIRRTSVTFTVHNKKDFEEIFLPHFLKPGASVVVDFGWSVNESDTGLYSIKDILHTKTDTTMQNFYKEIYGDDNTIGYLNKPNNKGRVNTYFGDVINYDASIDENGSYQCSLEFVSQNASLIDQEISEENHLKFVFSTILEDTIIAGLLGAKDGEYYNNLGTLSQLTDTEQKIKMKQVIFDTLYRTRKGEVDDILTDEDGEKKASTGMGDLSPYALQSGIYHQDLDYGTFDSEDEVLYINWGLFEDIFLNNLLIKKTKEDDPKYNVKFNSHECYVRWNENLYKRQREELLNSEVPPNWLYPSSDWSKTYNAETRPDVEGSTISTTETIEYTIASGDTLEKIATQNETTVDKIQADNNIENRNVISVGQVLKIFKNKSKPAGEISALVAAEKEEKKIPTRELFIDVRLIKDAFAKKQNVNDALKAIWEDVNADSYEIFDIKLNTLNRATTNIGFQDQNLLPRIESKQLIFDTTSGGSIVQNMDLKFEMPKSGLGSMIAIKGYEGRESFFDIKQLDDFRLLDLLDQDTIPFKPPENEKIQLKSLPKRPGQETDNLSDTFYFPFDYSSALGSLRKVFEASGRPANEIPQGTSDEIIRKIFDSKDPDHSEYTSYIKLIQEQINDAKVEDLKPKKTFKAPGKESKEKNVLYATSARDRWMKLAYLDVYLGDQDGLGVANVLPLTLNLTIYGNNYLSIGDYFSVNNLPKVYKNNCIFQIVGIEDKLETSGWSTTYETQFRILPEKKKLAGDASKYQVKFGDEYYENAYGKQAGEKNESNNMKIENTEEIVVDNTNWTITKIKRNWKHEENNMDKSAYNNPLVLESNCFKETPIKKVEQLAYLYAFSTLMIKYWSGQYYAEGFAYSQSGEAKRLSSYTGNYSAAQGFGLVPEFYYHTADARNNGSLVTNVINPFSEEHGALKTEHEWSYYKQDPKAGFFEKAFGSTEIRETKTTKGNKLFGTQRIPSQTEGGARVTVTPGDEPVYETQFIKKYVSNAGGNTSSNTLPSLYREGGDEGLKNHTLMTPPVLMMIYFPRVRTNDASDEIKSDPELYDEYICKPSIAGELSIGNGIPLRFTEQLLELNNITAADVCNEFEKYYREYGSIIYQTLAATKNVSSNIILTVTDTPY